MARRTGFGAQAEARRALVLASYDSKDDKIVQLFLEDAGRLAAVARHARKSKRRFGAHIEPLTLSEVVVRTRPDWELGRLERASTVEGFPIVKSDILRMALAMTMGEVVLMVLPEHDHDPELYALTVKAWQHLNDPRANVTEDLLLLFELRTLQFTGFLPDLDEFTPIPAEAREVLKGWLSGRWQPLTPSQRRRVATVLEGLLADQAGRGLRSREFLNEALDLRT